MILNGLRTALRPASVGQPRSAPRAWGHVHVTEGATARGIAALLPPSLGPAVALLPAIGVALNGTSSVLDGTVPELAPAERRQRACGLFYTGTIDAGALSPAIYGLFGDVLGIPAAMLLISAVVLTTLPLARRLGRALDAKM